MTPTFTIMDILFYISMGLLAFITIRFLVQIVKAIKQKDPDWIKGTLIGLGFSWAVGAMLIILEINS